MVPSEKSGCSSDAKTGQRCCLQALIGMRRRSAGLMSQALLCREDGQVSFCWMAQGGRLIGKSLVHRYRCPDPDGFILAVWQDHASMAAADHGSSLSES